MKPRLRRLDSDYQQIVRVFSEHPHVRLLESSGNPPDKYAFEFRVTGLVADGDETPREGQRHRAEIFLPADYPRRPPFCRMTTPVFHPNIDPQKICIGDHWSANQSLAELVVRIAQMICFQCYNTQSPLNGKAAAWVEENAERLPLQEADLSQGL